MTTFNIDPKTTHVLLIGTGDYEDQEHFENIPQIKQNLSDLHRTFTQKSILGVYDHHITLLYNQKDEKIFRTLADLCEDDGIKTLIIYYVGHSCVDGDFYLTAQNSHQNLIEQNGVNFEHIKKRVRNARAENVLIILDTCQSGRASLQGEREFLFPLQASKNIWLLTSSPRHKPSFFNKQYQHTYFTGALIKVLSRGIVSPSPVLELKQISKAIQDEMNGYSERDLPKPGYWSNNKNKFLGFQNRAYNPSVLTPIDEDDKVPLGSRSKHKSESPNPWKFLTFFLIIVMIYLFFFADKPPREEVKSGDNPSEYVNHSNQNADKEQSY